MFCGAARGRAGRAATPILPPHMLSYRYLLLTLLTLASSIIIVTISSIIAWLIVMIIMITINSNTGQAAAIATRPILASRPSSGPPDSLPGSRLAAGGMLLEPFMNNNNNHHHNHNHNNDHNNDNNDNTNDNNNNNVFWGTRVVCLRYLICEAT